MKILVLFPDQEAFFKGMGSEIVENYPEVSGYYEKCKKKTGLDIIKDCIYCESGKELAQEEKKLRCWLHRLRSIRSSNRSMKIQILILQEKELDFYPRLYVARQ